MYKGRLREVGLFSPKKKWQNHILLLSTTQQMHTDKAEQSLRKGPDF